MLYKTKNKIASILKLSFVKIFISTLVIISIVTLSNCAKDKSELEFGNYPSGVAEIMATKCATPGCHNDASFENAAKLNLSSWDKLFNGSSSGSTVIPYNSKYSSFMYFVNTYSDLGITNSPTMPLNQSQLSRDEVLCLQHWIENGAPNKDGFVKFSDNPNRKKYYVLNQSCKVVTVFDSETNLPMRIIPVANENDLVSPHNIKFSPDGKYWYVCTIGSNLLKKYNSNDDSFAGSINIGTGDWNTVSISPDSKKAVVVDLNSSGKVALCDLENMSVISNITYNDYPHGSCFSPNGNYYYISATNGNYIYKIDVTNPFNYDQIILDGTNFAVSTGTINPHEILFSPDGSKYAVTGSMDGIIRFFDVNTDLPIASCSVAGGAYEMAFTADGSKLFVTCMETVYNGNKGVVSIIDCNNYTLIKNLITGTQPHGIAIDDAKGLVYVSHRNIDVTGPLPHHTSVCGGRNGYLTYIDLNTLNLTGRRIELSADSYSIAIRP